MKSKFYLLLTVFILLNVSLKAQWTYLGLGNKIGTLIKLFNNNIYVGTDDGIYKKNLSNNDTIWASLGLQGKVITDFIIYSPDTILVSTYTSNIGSDTISLFITYDEGINWLDFQNGFGGSSGFYGCSALEINPSTPDTIYGRAGICVAKSSNKGNSWQQVFQNWGVSGYQDFLFKINTDNPSTIWAGGETGFFQPYLLKSVDYGSNWQFININVGGDNACYSLVINPNDSNELLVGMEGRIINSIDGGNNWNDIFISPTYAYIKDMDISPNNDDLVYASGGKNGGMGGDLFFYESYDFGISWDTVNYPGSIGNYFTNDIEIKKTGTSDELFFATNKGIYKYSEAVQCIANAGNDKVVCISFTGMDTIQIGSNPTATGGIPPYTYTWETTYTIGIYILTASDFLDDTTTANPKIINPAIIDNADKLTFYLTIFDSIGNTCVDSVNVQVSQFCQTAEDKSRTINQGDTVQLYPGIGCGIPPITYQWTPNYNLSDPNVSNPYTSPDTTTYYIVTIIDSAGCQESDQDIFQVYVIPVGINKKSKEERRIKITPNPFINSTIIEFENKKGEKYILILYKSIGQVVKRIDNIVTGKIIIARDNLISGLYFFQLYNDTEIVGHGKLIAE
ncbi:MAG: hypothetical protein ABII90_08155 [Bacteroidota bacterium]